MVQFRNASLKARVVATSEPGGLSITKRNCEESGWVTGVCERRRVLALAETKFSAHAKLFLNVRLGSRGPSMSGIGSCLSANRNAVTVSYRMAAERVARVCCRAVPVFLSTLCNIFSKPSSLVSTLSRASVRRFDAAASIPGSIDGLLFTASKASFIGRTSSREVNKLLRVPRKSDLPNRPRMAPAGRRAPICPQPSCTVCVPTQHSAEHQTSCRQSEQRMVSGSDDLQPMHDDMVS